MSIPTQALKYGWKVLATLTLGGATIFVANNQTNRITTATRIEIALGVTERCLKTQTGTNSDGTPIYAVAPPSIVRTWTDTNGVSVTVTNSIDWRDDLSMKIDLDAKIFALIPCYADTNTVYDGTTNIVMLTVTGLFASLQIGDHTNQFTAIPSIGTNAATFGPWAWRNYKVAWQERYKVLNALKIPAWYVLQPNPTAGWTSTGRYWVVAAKNWYDTADHWGEIVNMSESNFLNTAQSVGSAPPNHFSIGHVSSSYGRRDWMAWIGSEKAYYTIGPFSIYAPHSVTVWVTATNYVWGPPTLYNPGRLDFGGRGYIGTYCVPTKIIDVTNSYEKYHVSEIFGDADIPVWCDSPITEDKNLGYTHASSNWWWQSSYAYTNPVFFYCTNAYWE